MEYNVVRRLKFICILSVVIAVQFKDTTASRVHYDDFRLRLNTVMSSLKSKSLFSPRQNGHIFQSKMFKKFEHQLRHSFVSKANKLFAKNDFDELKAQPLFQSEIFKEHEHRLRHSSVSESNKLSAKAKNVFDDLKAQSPLGIDPDARRDVVQLVASLGYPVQEYTVQTKDGFLLTLHLVPYGRNDNGDLSCNQNGTRPSVFLQHGLLSSAADWVMNFANDSLALILADHGYDVWLGNSRGNTYSKRHVTLKPDDDKFWDWTFDEMAKYDVPAFIDFILAKTGESSVYYIGHSQGTMMAFAGLSAMPDYQKKIRLFVGMAPIISLNHIKSPIKYLSVLSDNEIYFILGRKAFFQSDLLIKWFVDETCQKSLTNWVCSNIVFLLCGYNTDNLNTTRLTVYMNHTPAGTSVKNMVHFAQTVRSKQFAMYDYGSSSENMKHYNQTTPPVYNPKQFNIPSLLYTATNDWLADPKDVQMLETTIPNIVGKKNIPSWNHLDFVWGMNAADKCYKDLLERLPKY